MYYYILIVYNKNINNIKTHIKLVHIYIIFYIIIPGNERLCSENTQVVLTVSHAKPR